MNRREFMSASGAALIGTTLGGCGQNQTATRSTGEIVAIEYVEMRIRKCPPSAFCQLLEDGKPAQEIALDAAKPKRQHGPIAIAFAHEFHSSRRISGKDLIAATLTLTNTSDRRCKALAGFLVPPTPIRPPEAQQVYVPLSAAGLGDPDERGRLKDCHQSVRTGGFICHYLEPQASDPRNSSTRATLLAPIVDVYSKVDSVRLALFSTSTEPMFFETLPGKAQGWRMGRCVSLAPGESHTIKGWMLLHTGDATAAWAAFHTFGHKDDFPAIAWPHDVRVHYYDFLGPVETDGHRGGGYDADLPHFGEFHVGMATQHGYYLSYGDFIHPDRKEWLAMPTDPAGPVKMTLDMVKARVDATRKAGVRSAIYMHYAILDEGSPLFDKMRDAIQIDAQGKPVPFGWVGPDTIKKSWRMSQNSKQWRDHLVQQARWIMELWNPDAIVLDETFASWGWDHHKDRAGPLSTGGIQLMRELRAALRSFGPDKALFSSDCSMANFCLWGDGEAGDHCYDRLLAQELYRQPPIRYMAALGNKAWLPCAWLYNSLWPVQMDLARKVGAAVSVTNGWGDNFGLTRLAPADKQRMLRDIDSLVKARSGSNG